MIIPLLVKIICNDVSAVQSIPSAITPPVKDRFRMQNNNAYRKKMMIKRSNLDKQVFNERFDENIDLKTISRLFDDPEQKDTKSLAQKLANEALRSPQLQRNIKKLANLSGTLHNHFKMKDLPNRIKNISKSIVSTRKINKLLNYKEKGKRKRDKHGLRQYKEHPWLREQNHIKVSKRKILLFNIF